MPTSVLDIEQHLLLLELEAPFNKRDVQLARRRMAKRWHPDVAPRRDASTSTSAISRRSTRPPISSSAWPRARAGDMSRVTPSRSAPPPHGANARRQVGEPTRPSSEPVHMRRTAPRTTRSAVACPTTPSCTATRAASPIPSGAWARSRGSTSPTTAETMRGGAAVGAREVQPRHAHGAGGEHEVRRLLKARPGL